VRAEGASRRDLARQRVQSARPAGACRGVAVARDVAGTRAARLGAIGAGLEAGDDLLLEALTEQIAQDIGSAKPGTYALDEPVGVRVTASCDGWRLFMRSSRLTTEDGDTIAADEVCWKNDEGQLLPLNTDTMVVDFGPPGESALESDLVLVASAFRAAGVYTGVIFVAAEHVAAKTVGVEIPVQVTIQQEFTHTVQDNKIYFHFADPAASQTATVTGAISADGPVDLIIEAQEGAIGELPLQKTFGSQNHPFDDPIPVTWKLVEAGSAGSRAPDQVSPGGDRASWELAGAPGDTTYELECTIAPEGYQAPGDYGKEWALIIAPRL